MYKAGIPKFDSNIGTFLRWHEEPMLTFLETMHYTRVNPLPPGSTRYLPSTAVFIVEVIKLVISFTLIFVPLRCKTPASTPSYRLIIPLLEQTFSGDSWKLTIPAALYTLQSSILYIAISNLSPATFQVTYQLKILTTVLFSVLLLHKQITHLRWLALIMLAAGIAIVQMPDAIDWEKVLEIVGDSPKPIEQAGYAMTELFKEQKTIPGSIRSASSEMNSAKGFAAVLAASMISGLTGVYFEKVVKASANISIWTRNVQLSFYSLFPALILGVWYQDGAKISQNGFFAGYNGLVWATILLQVMGGITVAVCITYTDNIVKNFATSFSIVVSAALGAWVFGSTVTGTVGSFLLFFHPSRLESCD